MKTNVKGEVVLRIKDMDSKSYGDIRGFIFNGENYIGYKDKFIYKANFFKLFNEAKEAFDRGDGWCLSSKADVETGKYKGTFSIDNDFDGSGFGLDCPEPPVNQLIISKLRIKDCGRHYIICYDSEGNKAWRVEECLLEWFGFDHLTIYPDGIGNLYIYSEGKLEGIVSTSPDTWNNTNIFEDIVMLQSALVNMGVMN